MWERGIPLNKNSQIKLVVQKWNPMLFSFFRGRLFESCPRINCLRHRSWLDVNFAPKKNAKLKAGEIAVCGNGSKNIGFFPSESPSHSCCSSFAKVWFSFVEGKLKSPGILCLPLFFSSPSLLLSSCALHKKARATTFWALRSGGIKPQSVHYVLSFCLSFLGFSKLVFLRTSITLEGTWSTAHQTV